MPGCVSVYFFPHYNNTHTSTHTSSQCEGRVSDIKAFKQLRRSNPITSCQFKDQMTCNYLCKDGRIDGLSLIHPNVFTYMRTHTHSMCKCCCLKDKVLYKAGQTLSEDTQTKLFTPPSSLLKPTCAKRREFSLSICHCKTNWDASGRILFPLPRPRVPTEILKMIHYVDIMRRTQPRLVLPQWLSGVLREQRLLPGG